MHFSNLVFSQQLTSWKMLEIPQEKALGKLVDENDYKKTKRISFKPDINGREIQSDSTTAQSLSGADDQAFFEDRLSSLSASYFSHAKDVTVSIATSKVKVDQLTYDALKLMVPNEFYAVAGLRADTVTYSFKVKKETNINIEKLANSFLKEGLKLPDTLINRFSFIYDSLNYKSKDSIYAFLKITDSKIYFATKAYKISSLSSIDKYFLYFEGKSIYNSPDDSFTMDDGDETNPPISGRFTWLGKVGTFITTGQGKPPSPSVYLLAEGNSKHNDSLDLYVVYEDPKNVRVQKKILVKAYYNSKGQIRYFKDYIFLGSYKYGNLEKYLYATVKAYYINSQIKVMNREKDGPVSILEYPEVKIKELN